MSPRPPGDPEPAGAARLVRRALHAALLLLGWTLFAWGWVRVAARPWDSGDLRLLVLGSLLLFPIVTAGWVLHNVGIHRRKGPRRSVPVAAMDYASDFNRRRVLADWPLLQQSRRIDVVADGDVKRYAAARPS